MDQYELFMNHIMSTPKNLDNNNASNRSKKNEAIIRMGRTLRQDMYLYTLIKAGYTYKKSSVVIT